MTATARVVPSEAQIRERKGWSKGTSRKQLFTFTEAERYEMLVALEGCRLIVHYGRVSADFTSVSCTLEMVAYPLDTVRDEPCSILVIRDEDGCPRTVRSASVRKIEILDE